MREAQGPAIPSRRESHLSPLHLHRRAHSGQGGFQGRGSRRLPGGGSAYLAELHVLILDAIHPGVLAAGANVLPLLVPEERQ